MAGRDSLGMTLAGAFGAGLPCGVMTRRGARVRGAAVAIGGLVAVVAGGGCAAGSPEAAGTLPPHSPVVSASPVATGVEADKRAAEQVVRDYFTAVNEASHSGDTSVLSRYFLDGCQACRVDVESIAAVHAKGETIDGNAYQLTNLAVGEPERDTNTVNVMIANPPGRLLASDGRVVDTLTAVEPTQAVVSLVRVGGSWRISAVTYLKGVGR